MIPPKEWARMLALEGLLRREREALSVLCWHWNSQDGPNHGRCDPAIPVIRKEAGVSDRTARRALDGLEDKGVIGRVLVKTKGSNKHHYKYYLRFMGQEIPEGAAEYAPPRGRRRIKGEPRTRVQWDPRSPQDGGSLSQGDSPRESRAISRVESHAPSVVTETTQCGQGDHTNPPQCAQGDHTSVVRVTTQIVSMNSKGSERHTEPPPAAAAAPVTTTNRTNRGKPRLRTMEARYESRCPLCRSKIYPGDRIMVNPGGKAAHAVCPAPQDAAAPPSPGDEDGGYRFEDEEDFGEIPPTR